ncbi:MAG: hypothetical protein R2822_23845 [Spirosomataceae bacterium]
MDKLLAHAIKYGKRASIHGRSHRKLGQYGSSRFWQIPKEVYAPNEAPSAVKSSKNPALANL